MVQSTEPCLVTLPQTYHSSEFSSQNSIKPSVPTIPLHSYRRHPVSFLMNFTSKISRRRYWKVRSVCTFALSFKIQPWGKDIFIILLYWDLILSSLSTVHLCVPPLNITNLPYNQPALLWDFNSVTVSTFVTIIGIFNAFSTTSKHYSNCLSNFNCFPGSVDTFINIICMLCWLQYGLVAHEQRVQWQYILVIFHLFCNYVFLTLIRK